MAFRRTRMATWAPGLLISCAVLVQVLHARIAAAEPQHPARRPQHASRKAAPKEAPLDMQMLATQVMLDRAGFSPGEIDARRGTSTERALDAYTKNGGPGDALPTDPLTDYAITAEDAAGPFTPSIPGELMEQAALPALNFTSVLEMLGERFHASPALLRRLNPQAKFAAGETIKVPAVAASAPAAPSPGAKTVTVRKSTSDVTVTDAAGTLVMYAPVTTGSVHDPLPIGEWKVMGVDRNPKFHYNPALFWDAQASDTKATIQAGPNNPVGVVWIDISRPHYGLHGTPEPSIIGKVQSHGCVRLTNWDALKLAALVRPGTKVVFAE